MTANILVVDDLETNIKVLEAKLLGEYYTVYTATSGMEALKVLELHNIDVILLDCMMPYMDGFETCRCIKANHNTCHIPVVIVTALYDVEERVKGLEAGADEFLTKPVDDVALFARLKSLSRVKTIIDELKLRNATRAKLGISVSDLPKDFSHSKILIIDDDIIQSKHTIKILSNITSDIKTVSDGDMVIDLLSEQFIPDATIISCQLEEQNPLRLLASLKANQYVKNSSIMMLAEEENMTMVIKALELGASDYFIVPIDQNELLARIRTQLRRKYYQDALRSDLEEGMNLSIKDGLSNLYNRRYFDTHLPILLQKALQDQKSLHALMVDIDNFKNVNDLYGHQAGDQVIRIVSIVLEKNLRVTDLLARYGGEEFVIIVWDTSEDGILKMAERIRSNIEKCELTLAAGKKFKITTSIGVSKYLPSDTAESFVNRADKALYEAKNSGRNTVRVL